MSNQACYQHKGVIRRDFVQILLWSATQVMARIGAHLGGCRHLSPLSSRSELLGRWRLRVCDFSPSSHSRMVAASVISTC